MKSDLSQESKDYLEYLLEDGFIRNEYDLIRAIKDMEEIERLLDILNKSNLKPKDKKDLEFKIRNGLISSEYKLKTEIENILNTYKSNSKNKKTSNSSRNKNKKPKRHSWEEYNKTHNTQHKKTFQDKIDSTTVKSERKYTPMFDTCPACSNPISKKDIYCAACGHKLKDQSYYYGNVNSIKVRLFMIEDEETGILRYSISKVFGFIILTLFVILAIIVFLFGIPSTRFGYMGIILFGGLFYYVLFRLAGVLFRKVSKFRK